MMMLVSFSLQVGNFITGIGNVICDKCEVGLADTRVTIYFLVFNFWEIKSLDHL
jgi:hypothetical protein